MYISENNDWVRYSSQGNWKLSSIKDCGKWMFYYKEQQFAIDIITKALDCGVVKYAKHTKKASGITCLYVRGTDSSAHMQVIEFMISNNLIRLTTDLHYFNIAFKFNAQSWQKEYGNPFEGTIKLSHLIDLHTGNTLADIRLQEYIQCPSLAVNRKLQASQLIYPIIKLQNKFITNKINSILDYQNQQIDLNDKLMHIIPILSSVQKINYLSTEEDFIKASYQLINLYIHTNSSKANKAITKLTNLKCNQVDCLISIFSSQTNNQQVSITNFKRAINNSLFNVELFNSIAYLLYLALLHVPANQVDRLLELN